MATQGGYQIKSTPFMRRLISTSKKNGQLQRLKREYERIKGFNERMIEVRMRQTRLNRLYRIIQIINENGPRRTHPRGKTDDELRAEQILRARQLGQEFSRRNAHNIEQNYLPREITAEEKKEEQRQKLFYKRLNYGNTKSRINMEIIAQSTPRRQRIAELNVNMPEQEIKLKRLQQRIQYGNNCSNINLMQAQRNKSQLVVQPTSLSHLRWLDNIHRQDDTERLLSVDGNTDLPNSESHLTGAMLSGSKTMLLDNTTEQQFGNSSDLIVMEQSDSEMVNEGSTMLLEGVLEEEAEILHKQSLLHKWQKAGHLVMEALRASVVQADASQTVYTKAIKVEEESWELRRNKSLERVILEDVLDTDDSDNGLRRTHNATNIQLCRSDDKYEPSEFVLPSSSNEESILPDELVLNCQRYIDHRSEEADMHVEATPSAYSAKLRPYFKTLDLRRKEESEPLMSTKEELLATASLAHNIRRIFEHQ